jgi:hypothetical protein
MNSTFKNISDPAKYTDGGVLYLNSNNCINFTIERCFFISCSGSYGGALYLNSTSFSCSVIINHCRFENNSAILGIDIYSFSSSCFLLNEITESCSSSPGAGIACSSFIVARINTLCEERIVYYYLL